MIESPETPSQDPLRPIAIEDVVSGEFDQEAEGSISPILSFQYRLSMDGYGFIIR